MIIHVLYYFGEMFAVFFLNDDFCVFMICLCKSDCFMIQCFNVYSNLSLNDVSSLLSKSSLFDIATFIDFLHICNLTFVKH